jgi:hypothetical protein
MFGPVTRDQHFQRLNAYRRSREYVAYARRVGIDEPADADSFPSLLGVRWQIDERIYNEFLEILPPMNWRGGSFMISEFCFGTITTKYTQEGERYYCEFVDTRKGGRHGDS